MHILRFRFPGGFAAGIVKMLALAFFVTAGWASASGESSGEDAVYPDDASVKRVLIIYSFTINFAPDFQFASEFTKAISEDGLKLRVKHVELDSFGAKDASDPAVAARLDPVLPDIRSGLYDVIIPIGQVAVDLLVAHAGDIPPETAVAFCGLDIVVKDLYRAHPNTTGALGRVSVADNIELGLHFYPKTKRVILLSDWSVQGRRILEAGRLYEESYPGLEYVFLDNSSLDLNTMLARIKEEDENTLVLFYAWFNKDSTNLASLQYMMSHLEKCRAPIFAMQEPMLWDGAIGGVFTPVEPVGRELASRVGQILRGRAASDITMAAIPLEASVNWDAVKSGRISEKLIPANSKIVGKSELIRNEDLPMFIVIVVALFAMFCLSALVTFLFLRLRSITRKGQAILAHIPGKIVVSDIDRNLLFIHSGGMICDNSTSSLKLDALPDFSRAKITEALDRVFATGNAERFECDFDGRRHSIELVKISRKVFGVEAVLWGMNDIDDSYRVRRRLDEELCKSRLTLDSVGDAVIVTDTRGRAGYMNPAACRMLRDGSDVCAGLLIGDYFKLHTEENNGAAGELSLTNSVIKGETVTQENCVLSLPDGTERSVVVSLAPICRKSGEAIGSVITVRDITRLREYQKRLVAAVEKAQNADRAKSYFLATMSHELRTPLNAVIGFSELLQNEKLPQEEHDDYLHSINLAGNSLLMLINDVLDLSKLEAGRVVFTPQATDLKKVLEETQAVFQYKVKQKRLNLSVVCEDVPPLKLDGLRVRQIMLNLIGNSVKFTEHGGIKVGVEFRKTKDGIGDLQVDVCDTGIGIAPGAREKIFAPFVQSDALRDSHAYNGTGLGLAISRRLAEQMGGCIRLESEVGRGSRFTLELNNVEIDAPGEAAVPDEAESHDLYADFEHAKILLVDDVEMNLKVLQAMLRKMDMECVCANSPSEALEILKKDKGFRLVLTDLWMPGMNGDELARKIKSLDGGADIRVIAVTADAEIRRNFDTGSFSGVLLKPLTREKLESVL